MLPGSANPQPQRARQATPAGLPARRLSCPGAATRWQQTLCDRAGGGQHFAGPGRRAAEPTRGIAPGVRPLPLRTCGTCAVHRQQLRPPGSWPPSPPRAGPEAASRWSRRGRAYGLAGTRQGRLAISLRGRGTEGQEPGRQGLLGALPSGQPVHSPLSWSPPDPMGGELSPIWLRQVPGLNENALGADGRAGPCPLS